MYYLMGYPVGNLPGPKLLTRSLQSLATFPRTKRSCLPLLGEIRDTLSARPLKETVSLSDSLLNNSIGLSPL